MRRAAIVSLDFITASKKQKISNLLQAYRAGVNFYLKSLWSEPGGLDKETLARLTNTRLTERYKSIALRQALSILSSGCKAAAETGQSFSLPHFTGDCVFDAKVVDIENGEKSFDLVIKLSSLAKGERIIIPTRRTRVLNKWLAVPGAKMGKGIQISENSLAVWVDLPDQDLKVPNPETTVGADSGVIKLLTLSDGSKPTYLGTEFRQIRDKLRRRVPDSNGFRRAQKERENYIGRILNKIPWNQISVLGIEDLKGIKKGKNPKRNKGFRKAMAPWTVRRVHERLKHKAQENRVLVVPVLAAYTSRICPKCLKESEKNRKGERFRCVSCGYGQDADFVGATNIRSRTLRLLGSLESPRLKNQLK